MLRSLKILEGQIQARAASRTRSATSSKTSNRGCALSEAFAKHPKVFDRLYVNMVKAGEAGGALEVILQRLADFKEKAQSLQTQSQGRDGLPDRRHPRGHRASSSFIM